MYVVQKNKSKYSGIFLFFEGEDLEKNRSIKIIKKVLELVDYKKAGMPINPGYPAKSRYDQLTFKIAAYEPDILVVLFEVLLQELKCIGFEKSSDISRAEIRISPFYTLESSEIQKFTLELDASVFKDLREIGCSLRIRSYHRVIHEPSFLRISGSDNIRIKLYSETGRIVFSKDFEDKISSSMFESRLKSNGMVEIYETSSSDEAFYTNNLVIDDDVIKKLAKFKNHLRYTFEVHPNWE